MKFVRNRVIAIAVLAALALSGCKSFPEETKTNYGPGNIVVVSRQFVCYTDAQIIDGKRTGANLCGRSHSGISLNKGAQIWAGIGVRKPLEFQLQDAISGIELPMEAHGKRHMGFLKCDPLNQESTSAARVTFCKLTLNDQVIVSAQVVFEPGSETRWDDKPASPLTSPISSLIESLGD